MIKVAVFGNRNIDDEALVKAKLGEFINIANIFEPLVILHGGAAGPAKIISEYADGSHDWCSVLFKPWTKVWAKIDFKPILFYLRNKQIVENADIVCVITNNERDSEVFRVINLCKRWKKDLYIMEV